MSKSVHLTPDIVEYDLGASEPLYDLIIGKQSLHDIGTVLVFKDKTITIDSILLPMRNIVNLQLKPSVTRALRHNTSHGTGTGTGMDECVKTGSMGLAMAEAGATCGLWEETHLLDARWMFGSRVGLRRHRGLSDKGGKHAVGDIASAKMSHCMDQS